MRIAIVGGGISGLVAAYRLRSRLGADADLVVLERGERAGGILHTGEVGGETMDLGAEAFVGRRPEVPALLRELGIEDQLVTPAGLRPLIWADGSAHPLPPRTLMGIPSDAESLRGLVDSDTLERIATESTRPLAWYRDADLDVHSLVADRFGTQVVERSVDPLLGGVYAGSSRSIGVRAALPTLAAALDAGATCLTAAVAAALPPPSDAPVFGGLRDGYRVLLDALLDASKARVVTGTAVTRLAKSTRGWVVDPIGAVDGVVLATPAPATARLLRHLAPAAATAAAGIELSSSVVVALSLPHDTPLPQHSGILVATGEPLRAKAFTLSSRKWPHLADRDTALVRASFGKFGDDKPLSWSDDELVTAATEDLSTVTGIPLTPLAATVRRWPGALAQYAPGHLDRIAELETATADLDGLALAGAYLHGVGVPACVASGDAAAERVAAALA
ncbi:protoporphyrinogen oxidase [Nocardia puris]|uniref:protoporphyrinogen oxidase n=1 Tax=Nocardia puris TaxID=208602 RepID=UPI0018933D67|nr:protoporphyrinogen oxidase [Nocardia puris]MBF6212779.1 protoporphyrinogen oxidase [Nocardia puris]MBF6367716.1 protoporphyrinogen oxidase [Nocardia puris]MBF6461367.1 protoporphyrinogen oxidase [Nocardia puris]